MHTRRSGFVLAIWLVLAGTATPSFAQYSAAEPPSLTTKNGGALLGSWTVVAESMQGPATFGIRFEADGDQVIGIVDSPAMSPEPIVMDSLTRRGEDFVGTFSFTYEGNMLVPTILTMSPEGDALDMHFDMAGGSYLMPARATRAVAPAEAAQSVPDIQLPLSPSGQAAIQVGGSWTETGDGGRRYSGGRWIVVDYSRPLLRGRANIFGSGADYGTTVEDGAPVWRAGANVTTTLTTQMPIVVGGTTLPPGVYNVFADLAPGEWTLILSNQPRQQRYDPNDRVDLYGAINYDPSFDLARVPMPVEEIDEPAGVRVEQFTISLLGSGDRQVLLRMAWDRTVATATIDLAP